MNFFNDNSFSFQMLHAMSYTPYQAADIGECIVVAEQIKEGDYDSWYSSWNKMAVRLEGEGDSSFDKGQYCSARSSYLRASNYYRTSGFYLNEHPEGDRFVSAWGKSRDLFIKAMELHSYEFKRVEIPFEDGFLPAYFVRPDDSGKVRPTLIALTGFDGTKEELFLQSGFEALVRDYNFLCFDGPGQGAVVREQKLYYRHDWEKVVTPVVDFLLSADGVDHQRIALMGVSYGGYLAARATAYEPRVAAFVANDGLYDLYDAATRYGEDTGESNSRSMSMNDVPITIRWALAQARWIFQATPEQYIEQLKKYSMKDIASKIDCPTLICEAENDHFFSGQPEQIFNALSCSKEYMCFKAKEGAGEHCHVGALTLFNARIFDWLAKVLKTERAWF